MFFVVYKCVRDDALFQEQVDESLVKEEIIEGSEDNQGEGMDSRIEYGGMGGGDSSAGGDEQSGKYSHQLDAKHGAQPLHEAVVEALAGPSGMQGVCILSWCLG